MSQLCPMKPLSRVPSKNQNINEKLICQSIQFTFIYCRTKNVRDIFICRICSFHFKGWLFYRLKWLSKEYPSRSAVTPFPLPTSGVDNFGSFFHLCCKLLRPNRMHPPYRKVMGLRDNLKLSLSASVCDQLA